MVEECLLAVRVLTFLCIDCFFSSMGRLSCRRLRRGARKIGYLLTCCAKGETMDHSNGNSSVSPVGVRTIDDNVTHSPSPLALQPSHGGGEDNETVLSTSDIEALASSLNIEDNNLPQWYSPESDRRRSLSSSETLTTVSSISNISLLQWSDSESDIFSQCGAMKLVRRDECRKETSTPLSLMSNTDYHEVEDYMRDLLWSTEVTSECQTVPVATAAKTTDSDDLTSDHEVESKIASAHDGDDVDEDSDSKILRSILNDGCYEISEEDHAALESVVAMLDNNSDTLTDLVEDTDQSTAESDVDSVDDTDSDLSSDSLTTVSTISNFSLLQWDDPELLTDISISSDSSLILSDSENDVRNDCNILRSILNDGHYDISLEDRMALEHVITMFDTTSETSSFQVPSERESTNETSTAEEVELSVCQNKGEDVSMDGFEINDHQILRSILDDGYYDISAEDRKALESVVATLEVTNEQSAVSAVELKH